MPTGGILRRMEFSTKFFLKCVGDDRRCAGRENSVEDHRGVVRATDQDLRTDVSQCTDILDRPKGTQALRQDRCGLYRERHLPALPSNGSEAKLPRTAPCNSSRLCFNGLQSPFRAMVAMGPETMGTATKVWHRCRCARADRGAP